MKTAILLCAGLAVAPAYAQLDNLDEAIRTTPITSQRVADGFHVLLGVGGNVAASIGDQGVLIVDDQFPGMVPKIQAEIRTLGGGDVDFAINTHWHFDHADGNQTLGPAGTWIVAHEHSRDMMTRDNVINLVNQQRDQPAYPAAALPVATYGDRMSFHFNGERIDLMHFGPAHTAGDTAVIFRGRNAVHMGDVFNNAGYPFVDADNGGSLTGIIEFCEAVLAEIGEDWTVIPGHGPVTDYAELADYTAMLRTIRDRVMALIAGGATLEQVVAAQPTREWDEAKGDPASFLNRSYTSLTR
jgi:glyoxylase-like metal-dependent hydrolase (beta-lactamase superfamily II)